MNKDIIDITINMINENDKKELKEMARVDYLKDKQNRPEEKIEVYVNTDAAGNKPHFHLREAKDWNAFHSCIRIDCCEYFAHEGKEDELNSVLRRRLVKFLQSKSEVDSDKINWEMVILQWNINNSNRIVDRDLEMPNYLNLVMKETDRLKRN